MCSEIDLEQILSEVYSEFQSIFDTNLQGVILYGSYARGDFDEESDLDIVALVNMDRYALKNYDKKIVSFTSRMDMKYNMLISATTIPYVEFVQYKDDIPYYANIAREGVSLSA